MLTAYIFLFLAIGCDLGANVLMKLSNRFRIKKYGIPAIVLAVSAFFFLMKSCQTLDLSTAYAFWGGLGLLATTMMDKIFFHVELGRLSWLGLFSICVGVSILVL